MLSCLRRIVCHLLGPGGGLGKAISRDSKLGMAVDVSHCGDRTTLDAFEASKKPVLITHSNCRALVPGHPRLKTDEAIKKMAASGGVMGITGVPVTRGVTALGRR